jgi:HPt (histidine-containing phosphotransfer) domain-containing protein
VPQFVQARAGLDVAALRHVVHTLKSSCASTGALTLAELCAQCDRNLREGRPLDQLGGLLDQVQAELLRVQGGLRQMRPTARSLAPA